MAEEYVIVDKADLEIIANSAREKTSTTDKYSVAALAEAMASTIVPPLPADSPGNKQLVTDSTGKTKWIDQYCSEEKSFITLLEEQTLDFSTDQSSVITFEIEGGKKYTVTVDGTDYVVTASDAEYIGDIVIPARIIISDIGLTINQYVFTFDDNGVHTIKISTVSETIKTLDDKFIPDSVSRIDDVVWDKIPGKPNINNGSGTDSIIEGSYTTASGDGSHSEGYSTTASGNYSHSEGQHTIASNYASHAEGFRTTASGESSHAEGSNTIASGKNSHAEGGNIGANGLLLEDRVVGSDTIAELTSELTIEGPMAYGIESHAEGVQTLAYDYASHAEGGHTIASESYSHAEGHNTTASGSSSHAEGYGATASGNSSHAEGYGTASGNGSHAEGSGTASGNGSHAEGNGTASGYISHAEGHDTTASGQDSHAEGYNTTAWGKCSHAEGGNYDEMSGFTPSRVVDSNTIAELTSELTIKGPMAYGIESHAEGMGTLAYGYVSHAEGYQTTAVGYVSHTEGYKTTASGKRSHAEGNVTIAASDYQHVQGKFNIEDADNKYAHIVGNGTSTKCSNAHTLDWDGNAWYAGTVEGTAMIVKSSTANSTKRFKITVDDSGTISATEITT